MKATAAETHIKKSNLQTQFNQQLQEFVDDNSDSESYQKFTPLREEVLVRLFKFKPEGNTTELGKKEILIWSELQKDFIPSNQAIYEKIYPIVKIIKKGLASMNVEIKRGGLYTVPVNDVIGLDWNPDFLFTMNNFAKQGKKNGMTHIPDDMEQKIPKLSKNWEHYKFSMPDRVSEETEEDELVYLIPELKLKAVYKFCP